MSGGGNKKLYIDRNNLNNNTTLGTTNYLFCGMISCLSLSLCNDLYATDIRTEFSYNKIKKIRP